MRWTVPAYVPFQTASVAVPPDVPSILSNLSPQHDELIKRGWEGVHEVAMEGCIRERETRIVKLGTQIEHVIAVKCDNVDGLLVGNRCGIERNGTRGRTVDQRPLS